MTTSSEPFPQESAEPDQRLWALFGAKRVLDNRAPFGKGEVSPIDLVDISKYILTGVDPYVQDVQDVITAEVPKRYCDDCGASEDSHGPGAARNDHQFKAPETSHAVT